MTKTPYRPRVGDERWVVEWCVKQGMVDEAHPEYGCEPDLNEYDERIVMTKEDAERIAREVYPLDALGSVQCWPATFTAYDENDAARYPFVGHWEATADPEHYEGY